jgi:hypothetical protein
LKDNSLKYAMAIEKKYYNRQGKTSKKDEVRAIT